MRSFAVSVKYRFPNASIATSLGRLTSAFSGEPLSPKYPWVPLPTTVVMMPGVKARAVPGVVVPDVVTVTELDPDAML